MQERQALTGAYIRLGLLLLWLVSILVMPHSSGALATDPPNEPEPFEIVQSKKLHRQGDLVIRPRLVEDCLYGIAVYRRSKLILNLTPRYDALGLGFAYSWQLKTTTRTFDGDLENYIPPNSPQSPDPFLNFDGDDKPELVVEESGNWGSRYSIYSLGKSAKKLGAIDTIRSEAYFIDLDKDEKLEVLARDPTFFGWKTCNAESPMPLLVLRLSKNKLEPVPSLMKCPPPDKQQQQNLLACWKQACDESKRESLIEDKNEFFLSPVVWRGLLELIYSGNSKTAFQLLSEFWEPGTLIENIEQDGRGNYKAIDRKRFEKLFLEQLSHSPYLNALKELNQDDPRIVSLRKRPSI